MINPGLFTRHVSVQIPTPGKTKAGGATTTFTHERYSFMARGTSGSGQERVINGRVVVPKQFMYTCHPEGAIDEAMRIVDAGKVYNILSVEEIENGMFFELLVEEVIE